MTPDPLSELLATLVSLLALWAFVRWPLRSLRRDLARERRRRPPRGRRSEATLRAPVPSPGPQRPHAVQ